LGWVTFDRHGDFKLLLATNIADVGAIPTELLVRSTVINFDSSSLEATKSGILHAFITYFDSDLMERVLEVEKAQLVRHVQVRQFESGWLESFASMVVKQRDSSSYMYYNDEETVRKLIAGKSAFLDAIAAAEAPSVRTEVANLMAPMEPIVDSLQTM